MSDLERRLNKLEASAATGAASLKVTFLRDGEPEPVDIEPSPPGVMHLVVRWIKPPAGGAYDC